MRTRFPEPPLVPPDPPDPVGECAYCGEDLYPGQDVVEIDGKDLCEDDYCIKGYVEDYVEIEEDITFDEDYTIVDYAHDYLIHYKQMPTEEDLEYMAAEAKIEDKLLERG